MQLFPPAYKPSTLLLSFHQPLLPFPLHPPPLLALFLRFLLSLSLLIRSGFFKGMHQVVCQKHRAFLLFCSFLSISTVSKNSISILLHLSRFLHTLLSDLIEFTPGLAIFHQMTRMLAAVSSFSSNRAYPFVNFQSSHFLSLNPTLTT